MDDSPYRSPAPIDPDPALVENPNREKVIRVARYQRWVIFALLGNITWNIVALATRNGDPAIALAIAAVAIVVILCTIVSVFLLAKEVANIVAAVFMALLMVVPCLSLLLLLAINQKATTFLQDNGVKVGFLGADPSRLQ